jgi:hypothetical protein
VIYQFSPDDELSQGDIIRRVRVMIDVSNAQTSLPDYSESNIIVMTRNCEISKPPNATTGTNAISVVRLIRLAAAPKGLQGDIRKNRVVSAFYLPEQEDLMEECYIDWRTVQPIDKSYLYTSRSQHYKCTVDREQFMACLEGYFVFLTKPD